MFEIKGIVNTALCFANIVEEEAIEQIRRMCDYDFTENSQIRIMPDVHAGKGCTIGTTMTITDKVVPNVVGVDIGCGMYTVDIGKGKLNFEKLDEACHFVPSGMAVWEERKETFALEELSCFQELKNIRWLERSLGTLGGGNHFIEVDQAGDGTNYLVIHSGSRDLGKQVAEIYQQFARHNREKIAEIVLECAGLAGGYGFHTTLDEAPMAYKGLEDVMDVIGESVKILDIMKPVYNFKASD